MAKRWFWILALLLAVPSSFALAQDEDEDEDVEIDVGNEGDTPPPAEEDEPEAKRTNQKKPRGAFPKRKPGEKHKKVTFVSRKKTYSIGFPDDWVVTETEPSARDGLLGLEVKLPGSAAITRFDLIRFKGMGDPRGMPYYWRQNDKALTTERLYAPVPRVIETHKSGDVERLDAFLFRRIKGNPILVRLVTAKSDFDDAVHKDLLDAAASLTAKLDIYPPIPKKYKRKSKGRYLFAAHPNVAKKCRVIEKIIVAQEKRFAKLHGKLPKLPRGEATIIFVEPTRGTASHISKRAADRTNDAMFDVQTMSLITVAVGKNNVEQASGLAFHVNQMLYQLKYGQGNPSWIVDGEALLASAELQTTKPLPYLYAGYADWQSQLVLAPLNEVEGLRKEWEKYRVQALWYAAVFRAGPAKFKSAYKAFHKEYAATHDWKAAFSKHIEPLGYEDIRSEAKNFAINKVKMFTPKGK